MNRHLNIFEHYSQKGALPIENNSTRNLGLVIKNNPLALFVLLDLIAEKSETKILKPSVPDDLIIDLQVAIKEIPQEFHEIRNVVGITLTTEKKEFYNRECEGVNTRNITDMIIISKDTLIIIEAKRDKADATEQLRGQLNEFKKEWEKLRESSIDKVSLIGLEWEEIIDCLLDLNKYIEEKDALLNDYIDHIKNRVPSFFPVLTFSKLKPTESVYIEKRIEKFARWYDADDLNIRDKTLETKYWIKVKNKSYIKEYAYLNYNQDLSLNFYPGNTI